MLCPAATFRNNSLSYCVCELTLSFSSDPYPTRHKNMHRWKLQLSQHMFRRSLNRDREDHDVPGINERNDLSSLGLMPAPRQDFIFQPVAPANRTWPLVLMTSKKRENQLRLNWKALFYRSFLLLTAGNASNNSTQNATAHSWVCFKTVFLKTVPQWGFHFNIFAKILPAGFANIWLNDSTSSVHKPSTALRQSSSPRAHALAATSCYRRLGAPMSWHPTS